MHRENIYILSAVFLRQCEKNDAMAGHSFKLFLSPWQRARQMPLALSQTVRHSHMVVYREETTALGDLGAQYFARSRLYSGKIVIETARVQIAFKSSSSADRTRRCDIKFSICFLQLMRNPRAHCCDVPGGPSRCQAAEEKAFVPEQTSRTNSVRRMLRTQWQ